LFHTFLPKADFEECRTNAMENYEASQCNLNEDIHQGPDHSSSFKKLKLKAEHMQLHMPMADYRLQVLPLLVT
jgi:hypothetical protein